MELTANMEHQPKRAREGSAFRWEVEHLYSTRKWALIDKTRFVQEEEMKKTAALQVILDALLTERASLVDQYTPYYEPVRTTVPPNGLLCLRVGWPKSTC